MISGKAERDAAQHLGAPSHMARTLSQKSARDSSVCISDIFGVDVFHDRLYVVRSHAAQRVIMVAASNPVLSDFGAANTSFSKTEPHSIPAQTVDLL